MVVPARAYNEPAICVIVDVELARTALYVVQMDRFAVRLVRRFCDGALYVLAEQLVLRVPGLVVQKAKALRCAEIERSNQHFGEFVLRNCIFDFVRHSPSSYSG